MSISNFEGSPSGLEPLELEADVLVIGGGPAGAWAAWSAASHGARVILTDKGYCGTSGATAPGGTNILYLPPDDKLRDEAVEQRMAQGGSLSERAWIHRVLDTVYEGLKLAESWGYPFRTDENGNAMRTHVQGPEYMRLMRNVIKKAGVRVFDQSPALELLADDDGVGGARGINRLDGRRWQIRANSVVIASGGCAFLSKGLGCNVLTGEGVLMAAEAGSELSGMEFSRQYAPSPAFGTVTRGRMLSYATITAADGTVLERGFGRPDAIPEALLRGPVYAVLDKANTPEKRELLRNGHAIFFLPYDRAGINPFTQQFPITMRYEGTVRGTGGLKLVDDGCSTTVNGLYAAGDAASRERVCGGASGGGAYNAAWAITSGTWAGKAAAVSALRARSNAGNRKLCPAGQSGIKNTASSSEAFDPDTVVKAVQREVLPLEINYFRSEPILQASLQRLHTLWPEVNKLPKTATVRDIVRSREAAAMAATARWIYTAALERKETRGMHSLKEHPNQDPAQLHRLTISGVGNISIWPERVPGSEASTAWTNGQASQGGRHRIGPESPGTERELVTA